MWSSRCYPILRPLLPPHRRLRIPSVVRFSSHTVDTTTSDSRLFLWLGDPEVPTADITATKPSVLWPPAAKQQLLADSSIMKTVATVDDIVTAVDLHYESSQQFVGGMGEEDLGVWFCARPYIIKKSGKPNDPLLYAPLIREGISAVKEHRHGIPFGMYTSGCALLPPTLSAKDLDLDIIEVSLFGATANQYHHCTGRKEDFHLACAFIALTVEQGVRVDAAVPATYANATRELAKALGARHVHVYDK